MGESETERLIEAYREAKRRAEVAYSAKLAAREALEEAERAYNHAMVACDDAQWTLLRHIAPYRQEAERE